MRATKRTNLRALQAFESVSRHLSVSKAADELGITQSAVSHQIRHLTDEVGEKLVDKNGRGISLTHAGERLALSLQAAFNHIDRSVAEAIGTQRAAIRIAICSSFAPGWLIPRLSHLMKACPGFDYQLCMYARDPDLTDAVADAFVTVKPKQVGFHSLFIIPECLVPVARADLADLPPQDIPLITTDLERNRIGNDWKTFLPLLPPKERFPVPESWLFATHYVVARDMVQAGLGAALVPDFLVASDVAAGKLKLLWDTSLATQEDYYLSIKDSRKTEPGLAALLRWFRQEVAQDRIRVEKPTALKA